MNRSTDNWIHDLYSQFLESISEATRRAQHFGYIWTFEDLIVCQQVSIEGEKKIQAMQSTYGEAVIPDVRQELFSEDIPVSVRFMVAPSLAALIGSFVCRHSNM